MKVKKKICDGCSTERLIWKNHEGKRFCKYCWSSHFVTVNAKSSKPTYRKPLANRSVKRAKQEREYLKVRKSFEWLTRRPLTLLSQSWKLSCLDRVDLVFEVPDKS